MQKNTIILLGVLLLLSIFVFNYSGSLEGTQIQSLITATDKQLATLEEKLANKQLKNAIILTAYAEQLKTLKPEFSELAEQLKQDASSTGPAISLLKERLEKVRSSPADIGNGSREAIINELLTLQSATNNNNYNNYLLDNINVISSLSGGALSPINSPSGQQNKEIGKQLVGNPTYGQWQQRNGMSVWEWYGAYAMLRTLTGGNGRYDYNDWIGSPSFYNRHQFTQQKNLYSSGKMGTVANDNIRQKKTYGSNTDRRKSSYFAGGSSSRGSIWGNSGRRSSSYGFSSRRRSSFGSFRRR